MEQLNTPVILHYANKLKYVKKHIGRLCYATMPEINTSLRYAKINERATGLIKLKDVYVKLPLIGYDGEYSDSMLNVLRYVPEEILINADAFSYKVKRERGISGIADVDARVTLYAIENQ